jgi:hypothetical protein
LEKTSAQIRKEWAELEGERLRLLGAKKGGHLGAETLRQSLVKGSERAKRIKGLEMRIKGLRAKLN